MSGHSKGPWRYEKETKKKYDSDTGNPRIDESHWIYSEDRPLALAMSFNSEVSVVANAQIMAAAPDLIASLKACVLELEAYTAEGDSEDSEVLAIAKENILFAEGEHDRED